MLNTKHRKYRTYEKDYKEHKKYKDTESIDKTGWNKFPDEMLWFLCDFFKYKLNNYEKLIFYGYYYTGFTLVELGERLHCTPQNISLILDKIEKRLAKLWKTRDVWRYVNDSK